MKSNSKLIYIICTIAIIALIPITSKGLFTSQVDLIPIRNLSFFESAKDEVVYFGRKTCPYCNKVYPVLLEEMKKENKNVYYFNTDEWRDNKEFNKILKKYEVESIPYAVRLKDNNISNTLLFEEKDFENKHVLSDKINKFIKYK
ncbi:thioredoxin family protein [Metaclostridioides mangenotii]|uniref:Bacteriocin transport accessory protein n=1 Tax=Metaclostridioides mangenotii TaxID=1540 RepID=A0ABS4EEL3_9FIRM|nr:thioredoxin family protein [Clostridioides mangenotii]MBP1856383.1 putative bacteriocin transport accessory protein [Clostridioides mangenotii]